MVAFAVGGLLGDTLFHLLPEIFLGEDAPEHVRFVLVEPNKNLLLGVAIMVGFVTFVAMDKGLRIATGGEGGHDHSHSHANGAVTSGKIAATTTRASGVDNVSSKGELKSRKVPTNQDGTASGHDLPKKEISPSVKLGGYLNLIADFTHNITDGLALSSSFYASPTIGATTTVAVFFHEIPHEVGDFALLIQSGFSKKKAMGAQFVTAVGAFLGTAIGISVQELGGSADGTGLGGGRNAGLMGTSLSWGDMLLPFTAGTFLYVGTVAVIPELLETGPNRGLEIRKTLTQFAAMATGAGIMLAYVVLPGIDNLHVVQQLMISDTAYRGHETIFDSALPYIIDNECRHLPLFTAHHPNYTFAPSVQSNLSPPPHLPIHPLSLTTCSSALTYSGTSFAPCSVKSLLLPSTTTYGTASIPFPACSRINIFTSCSPSYSSSMNALASASGTPAAVAAARSVAVAEGCCSFSKYCEYSAVQCTVSSALHWNGIDPGRHS